MVPPWREALERALARNTARAEARHVQLATVRADGRPANRTVVFRGFLEASSALLFSSDLRSAKVAQLERTPWAEACWSFPSLREQFRLLGTVTLVGPDHPRSDLERSREQVWRNLPATVRQSFTWPLPGAARAELAEFRVPLPDDSGPLPTSGLIILEPHEVDYLRLLEPGPHERMIFRHDTDGGWLAIGVNP